MPILFFLSLLYSTCLFSMSESLQERTAGVLIKKWLELPGFELPPKEEVAKAPMPLQENVLIPKIMTPVNQYFVWSAIHSLQNSEKDTAAQFYTDTTLDLPEDDIDSIIFRAQTQRVLLRVHKKSDIEKRSTLLYQFDRTQNKYQLIKRFDSVGHRTLSYNGNVIAIQDKKSNEIKLYFWNEAIQDGPVINKKLAQGQTIESILLNKDGSFCIITIKNQQDQKSTAFSVWSIQEDGVQEIKEFTNVEDIHVGRKFTNLLFTTTNGTDGIVSVQQREDNTFKKIWEKSYQKFLGEAINDDETVVVIATAKGDLGSYSISVSFKDIANGQDKAGYMQDFLTSFPSDKKSSSGYKYPMSIAFFDMSFVSPAYVACRLYGNRHVFFDGKGKIFEFIESNAYDFVINDDNALLACKRQYARGPAIHIMSFAERPTERGNWDVLDTVDAATLEGGYLFDFGPETEAAALIQQGQFEEDANFVLRHYELAGKWANHIKILKRNPNISGQQALMLNKLVKSKDKGAALKLPAEYFLLIDTLPTEIKELVMRFIFYGNDIGGKDIYSTLRERALNETSEKAKPGTGPSTQKSTGAHVMVSWYKTILDRLKGTRSTPIRTTTTPASVQETKQQPSEGLAERMKQTFWSFFGYK